MEKESVPEVGSEWEYVLTGDTYVVDRVNGLEVVLSKKFNQCQRKVDARQWKNAPYVQEAA